MRIGYARVSTQEQNLDLQKDALKRAGCKKIIEDVASGKTENGSKLDHVRELLREGDVLIGSPRARVDAASVAALRSEGLSWSQVCQRLKLSKGTARRAFYSLPNHPQESIPVNG